MRAEIPHSENPFGVPLPYTLTFHTNTSQFDTGQMHTRIFPPKEIAHRQKNIDNINSIRKDSHANTGVTKHKASGEQSDRTRATTVHGQWQPSNVHGVTLLQPPPGREMHENRSCFDVKLEETHSAKSRVNSDRMNTSQLHTLNVKQVKNTTTINHHYFIFI